MAFNRHRRLLSTLIIIFFICLDCCSSTTDTITSYQSIKDPQTLSSNNNRFTLGFFSPENSTNRYVGIWYMSKSTVIWVANRNQPLKDTSGSFTISEDGNLVVLNGTKDVIWSSKVSNISTNSSSQLQDSGNLVLMDNTRTKVWESFKHPTNTWIPNMKLTNNIRTGEKVHITSWKSPSDPSIGNFSQGIKNTSIPEVFIWNETRPFWRSGPWNGQVFIGIPFMNSSYLNGFQAGVEDGTSYVSLSYANESFLVVFVLNWQGKLERKDWVDERKEWQVYWRGQSECGEYGRCGAFGICSSSSSPICSCLKGFEPRNREEWSRQNWTSGCVRRAALQCESAQNQNGSVNSEVDGFLKLEKVKVPDFVELSFLKTEDTCSRQCLNNCSCNAYAFAEGIGCMSWSGNLIDIQQFSIGGIDLYIRLAQSELGVKDKKKVATTIITVTGIVGMVIIVTCAYFLCKHLARKKRRQGFSVFNGGKEAPATTTKSDIRELTNVELQELLLFDFEKLAIATNNFDESNKLGQGGFGPVYKGKLQDGQEIAVKRLSRASGQGLEEFVNEVAVISKLQHRNLVRLLGCCREGDEKMLIYEYMPNKSLDTFVFGPPEHKLLDWRRRFSIIEGIGRGLLYLHRDSRLRIIHRDLKASNVLLDEELNPKISDFGLARIFGGHGHEANTRRVVGTYGYMAPEYALGGLFSEKSDVFSFGILLLEIVSGRKNSSFYNDDESLSLLGFAWKLWNEDNIVSLIDPNICEADCEKEILRCVHIGLLCTQESARERPTMATVISMLNSEIVNLLPPGKPAFILTQNLLNSSSSDDCHALNSNNSLSITDIHGR